MQKRHRLRKSRDFAAARRYGKSRADDLLVLIARRVDADDCRFGFSVSKRVGNAVTRNRVKRRLREIARARALGKTQGGWDFVVIARRPAAAADYRALDRSMARLLRRLRIPTRPDADDSPDAAT